MIHTFAPINPARPRFENGSLRADQFKDGYFGSSRALDESRHVYLQGNRLAERFHSNYQFTVGELGFGTGVNFLLTCQLWREIRGSSGRLDYLAVEKHPISSDQLGEIHRLWPELRSDSARLLHVYPTLTPGCHRIVFEAGSITLTLLWGDATEQLELYGRGVEQGALAERVDAWFLDGFSPRVNPSMWQPELLRQVAKLTRPGGSFSTFSVAGAVRGALVDAGFEFQKQSGFDRKGEMLVGSHAGLAAAAVTKPWFYWPQAEAVGKVAVVGGGIAGLTTAVALLERGIEVELFEQHGAVGQQGSGNPGGIIAPVISADFNPASRFSIAAFELVHQRMSGSVGDGLFHPVGQVRLATDARQEKRLKSIADSKWYPDSLVRWADAEELNGITGLELGRAGLWLARAGWLAADRWCNTLGKQLAKHAVLKTGVRVARLQRGDGCWRLLGEAGDLLSEVTQVVLANAADATRLLCDCSLELARSRGQLAYLPTTAESRNLNTLLNFGHYLLPETNGIHIVGASYSDEGGDGIDPEIQNQLLQQAGQWFPQSVKIWRDAPVNGRVAWRAITPDRLPLVGPVSMSSTLADNYRELHHGRRPGDYPLSSPLPGIVLNTGHGSRGLVTATLAAELIASRVAGGLSPIDQELVEMVHPDRFELRRLRRKPPVKV